LNQKGSNLIKKNSFLSIEATEVSNLRRNHEKSFTVIIERDPESHWLVGEVVELPGCYTQAPDLPTLELNIQKLFSPT